MISQKPALAYGGTFDKDIHDPATLPEALLHAAQQEEEKGITYLLSDGSELNQSYRNLCEESGRILAGLRALGLQPGEKVILQVEENQQYVPAFWACVLGGLVAVPISIAPTYTQSSVITTKLQRAWELCEHPIVLASASLASVLRSLAPALGMESARIETVETLSAASSPAQDQHWHASLPDDPFLILFTSGSTGIPKGVMLTHRNVLSLARGYTHLEGLTPQEISFNWMPLDHIGGLVTFHLRDVYLGCQQIHTAPQTVLQDPLSWLAYLNRYRATCTWAPNFAFSLMNDHLATGTPGDWDLSSVHYILDAGEAIVPKTARRFLELLKPYGLPATAIHPSWGMSETSSGVTFSSRFSLETTSDDDRFVDVGKLIPQVWVRVVDHNNRVLEEGQSGGIQVKGPTVTPGYYRNPVLNQETFTYDGWFDTGDVGILTNGRLTITGRTKNIIIINGLNYYCHEIEAVIEGLPGVEVTYTAACAVRTAIDDTDALAIFYCSQLSDEQEIRKQLQEIRQRVVSATGVNPTYLLPVEKEAIPKTETGKIQRGKLKQQFEEGLFNALLARMDLLLSNSDGDDQALQAEESVMQTEIERQLARIWERLLGQTDIDRDANFFDLGGDSLIVMQLLVQMEETFQVSFSQRDLFDFPTVATLAQQIEQHQQETQEKQIPPIPPVVRTDSLPLSFNQQGLWFLDQLNPGSTAYSIYDVLRIQGKLHIPALEQSLQEIVQRHETLRMTFSVQGGQPALLIVPDLQIGLVHIPLDHLPAEEKEQIARQWIVRKVRQPFDLMQGPLVRFTLLHLDEEEYIFILSVHHIVFDGWSTKTFHKELTALYEAFLHGKPSPLPTLSLQFADFASWQHQQLQGPVLQSQLAYWKRQLDGAPALLALPTDHPHPPVQTDHGAHYTFPISETLLQRLRMLSQQENTTLFTTLLAAFKVLLYRYSGQEDLVVSTSVANRGNKNVEPLIGYFSNLLPLRTHISGSLSFRTFLAQVRTVTLEAYDYQDLPFEQMVNTLHLERNPSYPLLSQVVFVLQGQDLFAMELSNLKVSRLSVESGTSKFDLFLEMREKEDGLSGSLEYNTDLFEAATIERMMAHWQTLLEGIVLDPQQRIADLPLLSSAQRHQLLGTYSQTRTAVPFLCVHQLIEAQAMRTPEALAVSDAQQQLSYRELNERANQLAHYLIELGVGPEVLVGICLERSVEMLIGLLAILKAGGAYVPLDPNYPKERLALMLADAHVAILLTQQRLLANLPSQQAQVVCLDSDKARFATYSTASPAIVVEGEHPVYVIYTSGSTGQPKGVQVVHRGLCNLIYWHQQAFAVTPQDRATQLASVSFDAAGWEIWPYLSMGAAVCFVEEEVRTSPSRLSEWMATERITICFLPTPLTESFLDTQQHTAAPMTLRTLLTGGDRLHKAPVKRLPFVLVNNYGPTEYTVVATSGVVSSGTEEGATPSIGHPIANTRAYVLDKAMQPVPIGVEGELYLGGAGLARGYLYRPDLTAERFLPDPFSDQPGARLYKTGDLVRYRSDGSLDFSGRNDTQVKLRGFRIELGEIEAALNQHPLVREAAVLLSGNTPDEQRLLAYVVAASTEREEQEEPVEGEGTALVSNTSSAHSLQAEYVAQWQGLYEQAYKELLPGNDPTFNISGWNSSYTGQPIPAEEMRVWREDTVNCIRSLRPRRVLEIGCGSGLILFPLAPDCVRYDASDFSSQSLAYVRKVMEQNPQDYRSVSLWQREANIFEDWEQHSYDVVILNSVVQYFPDASYLQQVLQGALQMLAPGGTLFVGDVRSLPLHESFHLEVQLAQGSEELNRQQVLQLVQRGRRLEKELLIDPALFVTLSQQQEPVARVHILPRRGNVHNELTQFRYHALIHLQNLEAERKEDTLSCTWRDWRATYGNLEALREMLQREQPAVLGVSHIPNARLERVQEAQRWLKQESEPETMTLGGLRQRLRTPGEQGVEWEVVEAMGRNLGYEVQVSWARQAEEGRYDMLFVHQDATAHFGAGQAIAYFPLPTSPAGESWQANWNQANWNQNYTNQPLDSQQMRLLVPRLRRYLQECLPDYMVPMHLTLLEQLPLTPNGKVDRRALLALETASLEPKQMYVAPRTPVEDVLAGIWAELLGVNQVGLNDNFFELGGHSLLATQLIFRISRDFQVDLPLLSLFEHPSLVEQAEALVSYETIPGAVTRIAQLRQKIQSMSQEQRRALLEAKRSSTRG